MPQSQEIRFKAGTNKAIVFAALKNIAKARRYNEIASYEFIGMNLQEFEYEQFWDDSGKVQYQILEDSYAYV